MGITAYHGTTNDIANDVYTDWNWESCIRLDVLGRGVYFFVGKDNNRPDDSCAKNNIKSIKKVMKEKLRIYDESLLETKAIELLCKKLDPAAVQKTIPVPIGIKRNTKGNTSIEYDIIHICVRHTGCINKKSITLGREEAEYE